MTQPAIATDPVCGMDVDTGTSKLTSSHQGQTYHFCSAGCKQAFDGDPARYLSRTYRPSMLGAMLGRVRNLFGGKRA
jgi:Cu+-exporting ATPase